MVFNTRDLMPKNKTLIIAAGIVGSFVALAGTIVFFSRSAILEVPMAKLMVVALIGLYVGFGILIAAYRLLIKLQ